MLPYEVVERILTVGFFAGSGTCMFLYMYNWRKLQNAYLKVNGTPLFISQRELNETVKRDLIAGYKIMFKGMSVGSWVLFRMKTDNPELKKPLRRIRMSLLAFILLPFVLAFFAIVMLVP